MSDSQKWLLNTSQWVILLGWTKRLDHIISPFNPKSGGRQFFAGCLVLLLQMPGYYFVSQILTHPSWISWVSLYVSGHPATPSLWQHLLMPASPLSPEQGEGSLVMMRSIQSWVNGKWLTHMPLSQWSDPWSSSGMVSGQFWPHQERCVDLCQHAVSAEAVCTIEDIAAFLLLSTSASSDGLLTSGWGHPWLDCLYARRSQPPCWVLKQYAVDHISLCPWSWAGSVCPLTSSWGHKSASQ